MRRFSDLAQVQNDDLRVAEVGPWSEDKYRLLSLYASIFSKSMHSKWDSLVYVDLFAGPGYARFKGTSRIYPGSPLIALDVDPQFYSYVFCEAEKASCDALSARIARDYPTASVTIIPGDANDRIAEVIEALPPPSKSKRVLGFCFVDPYKLSDLRFETIRQLSSRFMDFLVLVASGMDVNRNEQHYLAERNRTVEDFLGVADWRPRWLDAKSNGVSLENFIVQEFSRSMNSLKYKDCSLEDAQLIRSADKNLPLYRLAFFSRHDLGKEFWREARRLSNPQTGFSGEGF